MNFDTSIIRYLELERLEAFGGLRDANLMGPFDSCRLSMTTVGDVQTRLELMLFSTYDLVEIVHTGLKRRAKQGVRLIPSTCTAAILK